MRLQDCLHGGDEFSNAFKVNYISEDLFPGNGNFSFEYVISFLVPKRGDAIIRGGAIFGGNTVYQKLLTPIFEGNAVNKI